MLVFFTYSSTPKDLFFVLHSLGEERPAKTKLMPQNSAQCQSAQSPTPCSVSQHRVRLHAVLVSAKSEFAQCQSVRSLTLHSISQRQVRLRYALISAQSLISRICPRKRIYHLKKTFQPVYQGPKNLLTLSLYSK